MQRLQNIGILASHHKQDTIQLSFDWQQSLAGNLSCVPGVGIKLAHKLVRLHRTPLKIFSALRAAG
jgi:hypothetical protein